MWRCFDFWREQRIYSMSSVHRIRYFRLWAISWNSNTRVYVISQLEPDKLLDRLYSWYPAIPVITWNQLYFIIHGTHIFQEIASTSYFHIQVESSYINYSWGQLYLDKAGSEERTCILKGLKIFVLSIIKSLILKIKFFILEII